MLKHRPSLLQILFFFFFFWTKLTEQGFGTFRGLEGLSSHACGNAAAQTQQQILGGFILTFWQWSGQMETIYSEPHEVSEDW